MGGTYVNIYEKLLSISRDASAVAKNLTVGVGKSSYKAVGEADVLTAVKPLEAKYGVYSYPISRRIINAEVYTAKNDYGEKARSSSGWRPYTASSTSKSPTSMSRLRPTGTAWTRRIRRPARR